jgi:hypothetical protein
MFERPKTALDLDRSAIETSKRDTITRVTNSLNVIQMFTLYSDNPYCGGLNYKSQIAFRCVAWSPHPHVSRLYLMVTTPYGPCALNVAFELITIPSAANSLYLLDHDVNGFSAIASCLWEPDHNISLNFEVCNSH